jgi:hypothetical protein
MPAFDRAKALPREFKGDTCLFGAGALPYVSDIVDYSGAALVTETIEASSRSPTPLTPEMVDQYMGPVL